jgi:hypothetical protein
MTRVWKAIEPAKIGLNFPSSVIYSTHYEYPIIIINRYTTTPRG